MRPCTCLLVFLRRRVHRRSGLSVASACRPADRRPVSGPCLCGCLGDPKSANSRLFLLLIVLVALVVGVYSLGYIRDERRGWYWFFLLLTFASLAGIVSTPDTASMYGYWELMTFASYFLVVHEGRRTAFEAGLKYYVMCAGGRPVHVARACFCSASLPQRPRPPRSFRSGCRPL